MNSENFSRTARVKGTAVGAGRQINFIPVAVSSSAIACGPLSTLMVVKADRVSGPVDFIR